MPKKYKINAVIVFALAILFDVFFDFAKHNPSLSLVNPFADDPYDAVGSFAFQAVIFLGTLSLFRAFRPYSNLLEEQKVYFARTQIVIVLTVLVALAADIVAMIRHLSLWLGVSAGYELVALVIGFTIISAAILLFTHRSTQEVTMPVVLNVWKTPLIVSLVFFAILFLYPESIKESTFGALFTVIIGAALLFAPVRIMGESLSPQFDSQHKTAAAPRWLWGVVVLVGILLGFSILLRELSDDGGVVNLAGSTFIISVYIGLEVSGLLIGYGFLGKFLGLFRTK